MTTRDDVVMAAKNVMCSGTGSVFLFRALDTKAVAGAIVALSDERPRPQETPRRAPDAGAGATSLMSLAPPSIRAPCSATTRA